MRKYTFLGILAVLLWGSNMGVTRILSENIGGFVTCGIEMTSAGCLLLSLKYLRNKTIRPMLELPRNYLIICGFLFVFSNLCLYFAINLCKVRSQVLIVSAMNYLWPVLSVILSIPVLHKKFKPLVFTIGILITVVATFGISFSIEKTNAAEAINASSYAAILLAFLGALFWAGYTVLVSRFLSHEEKSESALPFFMLETGAISLVIGLLVGERLLLTKVVVFPLLYTIIFPCLLAYLFWDLAIQKGNVMIVSFFSLFSIALSILSSTVILHIPLKLETVGFCLLIISGVILTRKSLIN
ncbi:MAG: EamA family transporter [Flexilinea sp.]